jgi:hypothetical protein
MTSIPLLHRSRRRGIVDRLDLVAREIDDRAAARLGNGLAHADPEVNATFIRVGSRPALRR